jgi:queuine/archaeosine tRNA-ribosyltransferase
MPASNGQESKLVKIGSARRPRIWLGQSVNTSSICAHHPDLRRASFLTSLGCAIKRPMLRQTHLNSMLREKLGVSGPIMVDSGGFALLNNPNSGWTVRKVGDLIEKINAEIFVSLDLPPSKEDDQAMRKQKIRKSAANYGILADRFPRKIIMPVIHGRTLSEIELSIEGVIKQKRNPTWVGLGGIVPLLQNRYASKEISTLGAEVFIGRALAAVRLSFPTAQIHAFGAGGTRTFPAVFALGADSGDSIGWRQAAGFGSVFLPLKTQRVVSWNVANGPPRKVLDETDMAQIDACGCPICRSMGSITERLALLRKGFYYRSIHNAWTISNQHKYWPKTREAMRTLVSSGALGSNWAKAAG